MRRRSLCRCPMRSLMVLYRRVAPATTCLLMHQPQPQHCEPLTTHAAAYSHHQGFSLARQYVGRQSSGALFHPQKQPHIPSFEPQPLTPGPKPQSHTTRHARGRCTAWPASAAAPASPSSRQCAFTRWAVSPMCPHACKMLHIVGHVLHVARHAAQYLLLLLT